MNDAKTDRPSREQVLSQLLRGIARRLYRLRRDYKIASVDPWENPEYCAKANWAMDCGPALRDWDLCIYHARQEHRELRVESDRQTAALTRIAAAHCKYVDSLGGTDGNCRECRDMWPCPTYAWATTDREPLGPWNPIDDEPDAEVAS